KRRRFSRIDQRVQKLSIAVFVGVGSTSGQRREQRKGVDVLTAYRIRRYGRRRILCDCRGTCGASRVGRVRSRARYEQQRDRNDGTRSQQHVHKSTLISFAMTMTTIHKWIGVSRVGGL